MMGQCAFDLHTPVTKGVSGILLFRGRRAGKAAGQLRALRRLRGRLPGGADAADALRPFPQGVVRARARRAASSWTASSAAPAPISARRDCRWCSISARPRARCGARRPAHSHSDHFAGGESRMEDMALKRASSSPHIHAGRTVQGVDARGDRGAGAGGRVWRLGILAGARCCIIAVSVPVGRGRGSGCTAAWRKSPARWGISAPWSRGILLAYNLPAERCLLWMPVDRHGAGHRAGKTVLFGGLGANFVNPALTARAILMTSWVGYMSGSGLFQVADAGRGRRLRRHAAGGAGKLCAMTQLFMGHHVPAASARWGSVAHAGGRAST